MRILIGPADASTNTAVRRIAPDCRNEFRTFGGGEAEKPWNPAEDDYRSILLAFPPDGCRTS